MDNDPDQQDSSNLSALDQPHVAELLRTLLDYRTAEEAMRRRTGEQMHMGENDVRAIRFLLKEQDNNRLVSGRELADHLDISSASVSVLVDRLSDSDHVLRLPHPTDRRSNVLTATAGSDEEVKSTLGAMHARMIEVTRGLSAADAELISGFLESMTDAVNRIDKGTALV